VLANTLFYLYHVSKLNTARDSSFYDITPPKQPKVSVKRKEDGTLEISARSKDKGTTYEYKIEANSANGDKTDMIIVSNIVEQKIKSELAGFVICFNDSAKPGGKELVPRDENGERVINIHPVDDSGKAVITIKPESGKCGRFIHVFAIDRSNNISEERIIEIPIDDTKFSEKEKEKEKEKEEMQEMFKNWSGIAPQLFMKGDIPIPMVMNMQYSQITNFFGGTHYHYKKDDDSDSDSEGEGDKE